MSNAIPALVLASGSPRRAELLSQLGLSYSRYAPDIDETPLDDEQGCDYVLRIAEEKLKKSLSDEALAHAKEKHTLPRVVLCADTTVLYQGRIMGKPVDRADAIEMLQSLSNTTHQVVTSVAIGTIERPKVSFSVETNVTFRSLTYVEIENYWATGDPADKAGSYGIQGIGGIFISNISGSYSNVVGLPMLETAALLADFGIDVLAC